MGSLTLKIGGCYFIIHGQYLKILAIVRLGNFVKIQQTVLFRKEYPQRTAAFAVCLSRPSSHTPRPQATLTSAYSGPISYCTVIVRARTRRASARHAYVRLTVSMYPTVSVI